jgi:hypothetical protein
MAGTLLSLFSAALQAHSVLEHGCMSWHAADAIDCCIIGMPFLAV